MGFSFQGLELLRASGFQGYLALELDSAGLRASEVQT